MGFGRGQNLYLPRAGEFIGYWRLRDWLRLLGFEVEAGRFGLDDAKVLALLPSDKPVLLVANKLDTLTRRNDVLPWLQQMQAKHSFAEFVPMSATREADVQRLLGIVQP